MKYIGNTIKPLLLLLSISSANIFADDFQMQLMGSNPIEITFCNTELAAAQLALTTKKAHFEGRRETIANAKIDLNCKSELQSATYILHKTTFVKLTEAKYDYTILDIQDNVSSPHKFINKDDLGPYSYVDTSCQKNAAGGQVNRMEADKNGRLYLKKYLVSTTCVNGKSKVNWKPLN